MLVEDVGMLQLLELNFCQNAYRKKQNTLAYLSPRTHDPLLVRLSMRTTMRRFQEVADPASRAGSKALLPGFWVLRLEFGWVHLASGIWLSGASVVRNCAAF